MSDVLLQLDAFYESGCRIQKKEWSPDELNAVAEKGYRVIGCPGDGWFVVRLSIGSDKRETQTEKKVQQKHF